MLQNEEPTIPGHDPATILRFKKRSIFDPGPLNFRRIMSEEIPEANPPLSEVEQLVVAKLAYSDLLIIDAAILRNSSNRWLKVARVVVWTETALRDRYPGLSYIFYAQRLIRLVEEGRLESQGNLEFMRFSEVRTPAYPATFN